MRFVILRKAGRHTAAGLPSSVDAAHGVEVHTSAPLQPAAAGARIRFSDDGPRQAEDAGAATVAALQIVEAASRQTVIDWLRRAPLDDAEFEIREAGCPGGLPGIDASAIAAAAPKPRFLILLQADADSEADAPVDAARLDAMARRNDEAVKAGVLLAGDGLQSSAKGARVKFSGGRSSVVDGPFAEAKELVAGFWLIQAGSLDDAIAWVCRYPYAQERPAIEIRPVAA